MTKVIILGEAEKKELDKKPIKFVSFINDGMEVDHGISESQHPKNWKNIELVSSGYTASGLDLIFAYDDTRNGTDTPTLFFGHFNDGVV